MAKRFSEEAVVRIWRNHREIRTGHFGHAAISLRGQVLKDANLLADGEKYVYISWWPGEGAGKGDAFRRQEGAQGQDYFDDAKDEISERAARALDAGAYAPRAGQKKRLVNGEWTWGQAANEKLYIPGLGRATEAAAIGSEIRNGRTAMQVCSPRYWGISTRRMAAWWQDFAQPNQVYRLASKSHSCAGAAAQALEVGGATAFAPRPSARIYMVPNQIEAWAEAVRDKINERDGWANWFVNARNQVLAIEGYAGNAHNQNELWGHDTWIAESRLGGLKVRSSTIKKIGTELQNYHRKRWDDETFPQKLTALGAVFDAVMQHTRDKPNSERRRAVTILGYQCVNVLSSNAVK